MIKYTASFLAGLATCFWALGFIYLKNQSENSYFFIWLSLPLILAIPAILYFKMAKSRVK